MTVDEAIEKLQQFKAQGFGSCDLMMWTEDSLELADIKLMNPPYSAGPAPYVEVCEDYKPRRPFDGLPHKPGAYLLHMKDGKTERALVGLMGEYAQMVAFVDRPIAIWQDDESIWRRVERAELVAAPVDGTLVQPPDDWFKPAQ